mgnify:CR=1 FL=1
MAAAVCMLVYIWFRFELMFGFAAILALVHDVAILLAIYSIFRVPVNSSFIAAVLNDWAEWAGFGGIGIYTTHVHCDLRPEKARWRA